MTRQKADQFQHVCVQKDQLGMENLDLFERLSTVFCHPHNLKIRQSLQQKTDDPTME